MQQLGRDEEVQTDSQLRNIFAFFGDLMESLDKLVVTVTLALKGWAWSKALRE